MAETEAAGGKKSSSTIVTIAAIAGLSVAAAGGGWLVGTMLAPTPKADAGDEVKIEHDAKKIAAAEETEKVSTPENGVAILDPMTTNLAYPSENWVRLEVALLFRDKPDVQMATTIHQDLMAYLRTVSLQQIEGPRGFAHLRDDLEERAELRSEGRVTKLMIRTFVIE